MCPTPERAANRGRRLPPLPVLAVLLGLGACASLDPAPDLDAAGQLVAARAGVTVDWRGPFDPRSVRWPPEAPLTSWDVARLALHNHAGIRVTVESIALARAEYVQAHLLPNPVLNLSLGFPIDGGSGDPGMGSLLQPLAALWQRGAAIDRAGARLRAAVLRVSDAALELVARARLAHAELLFAERDLELLSQGRDLAAEAEALVGERLAREEATALEFNGIRLEALDAGILVTEATVRRDRARRELLRVCGVPGAVEFPAVDRGAVPMPGWVEQLTEVEVVRLAETQRLDLAAAEVLASGAVDAVRLAELQRIPGVSLGAAYQQNFQGREEVGPVLGLELPLFDDGRARVAKSEALAGAARAETERVRQAAVGEVRHAFVQLRGELANLTRARDSVLALATANRELAERSLAAGVVDRVTVIELARRELRVRAEVARRELAVTRWFVELERAAGGRIAGPGEAD